MSQIGTGSALPNCALEKKRKQKIAAEGAADDARRHSSQSRNQEWDMHQIIYLVGLIVVILAILSFFGLR